MHSINSSTVTCKEKLWEHLKDAVELDPSNWFDLTNLGLAYVQMGRVEEGLAMVKQATEMSGTPENYGNSP